jgi:hypothetical protein
VLFPPTPRPTTSNAPTPSMTPSSRTRSPSEPPNPCALQAAVSTRRRSGARPARRVGSWRRPVRMDGARRGAPGRRPGVRLRHCPPVIASACWRPSMVTWASACTAGPRRRPWRNRPGSPSAPSVVACHDLEAMGWIERREQMSARGRLTDTYAICLPEQGPVDGASTPEPTGQICPGMPGQFVRGKRTRRKSLRAKLFGSSRRRCRPGELEQAFQGPLAPTPREGALARGAHPPDGAAAASRRAAPGRAGRSWSRRLPRT